MKTKKVLGLALALALLGAACASDTDEEATSTEEGDETTEETEDSSEETEDDDSEEEAEVVSEISLSFDGLETLDNGAHYEGWVLIDGEPYSTGKFNVDGNDFVDLDGEVIEATFGVPVEVSEASDFVLTVEPDGDTDTIPSDPKLLGGVFEDGVTTATIDHPGALNTDFSEGTGSFTFRTPTDDDDTNELAGVWFLSLTTGEPVGTLDLPELPEVGWEYEGWAVIDGTPYSTGKFSDPTGEGGDDFSGFSGPLDAPPYPGEDFLVNLPEGLETPVDLSGVPIVISVEPIEDDSELPFVLKPYVGSSPEEAESAVDYDLEFDDSTFPTITAEAV